MSVEEAVEHFIIRMKVRLHNDPWFCALLDKFRKRVSRNRELHSTIELYALAEDRYDFGVMHSEFIDSLTKREWVEFNKRGRVLQERVDDQSRN